MSDPVAAIGAVSAMSPSAGSSSVAGVAGSNPLPTNAVPSVEDAAHFQSLMQSPSSGAADVGGKLVDAGVGLSNRYSERLGAARELASISPDELGIDHVDYMRAMLDVQVSLNQVTVELQSTAQIANSVKDSFNGLYRMQG